MHIVSTLEAKKILNSERLDISADGIFGFGNERAVKEFQREEGLTVDGIVGRNKWAAIKEYDECDGETSAGDGGGNG